MRIGNVEKRAVCVILICLGIVSIVDLYAQEEGEYVPRQLIVKLRDTYSLGDIAQLNGRYNVVRVRDIFADIPTPEKKIAGLEEKMLGEKGQDKINKMQEEIDKYMWLIKHREEREKRAPKDAKVPRLENYYLLETGTDVDLMEMMIEYESEPSVEFADLNYILTEDTVEPNDPRFPEQWHLEKISAPYAWDVTVGNEDVVVAIIDNGIDQDHIDLNGKVIDFIGDNCDDSVPEISNHGTACAGIVAAGTNNNEGVAGITWECKLLEIRHDNPFSGAELVAELKAAADYGADILSISYSGGKSWAKRKAIDYAYGKGCIIIVSAGNSNDMGPRYPAAYDNVVGVAATDRNDKKANFSNYGSWVDISAPGISLLTTDLNNNYRMFSGTSAACPVTAGVMALAVSGYKDLGYTNQDIVDRVLAGADDINDINPDYRGLLGKGRVNACKALYLDDDCDGNPNFCIRDITVRDVEGYSNRNNIPEAGEQVGIEITIENLADARCPVTEVTGIVRAVSCDEINFVRNETGFSYIGDNRLSNAGTPHLLNLGRIGYDTNVLFTLDTYTSDGYHQKLYFWIVFGIGRLDKGIELDSHSIDISGDKVVWHGTSAGLPKGIYVSRIGIYNQVFEDENGHTPKISGNRFVYTYENRGQSDILLYDITGNDRLAVAETPMIEFSPDISGDLVVWAQKDDNNGKYKIKYSDYGNSRRGIIADSIGTPPQTAVSGDRVVWVGDRLGFKNIYLYDFSEDKEVQITGDINFKFGPAISGDIVVWAEIDHETKRVNICAYDIGREEKIPIVTGAKWCSRASIDGKNIVWSEARDENKDVYIYNLDEGAEKRITMDSSAQINPVISGNIIAWVDQRKGRDEIYLASLIHDYTPPTKVNIRVDEYTNSTDILKSSWTESVDRESSVVLYEYIIAVRDVGRGDVFEYYPITGWIPIGLKREVEAGGLELRHGYTYCFRVRTWNGAGMYSRSDYSSGTTVDLEPPIVVDMTNPAQGDSIYILFKADADDELSDIWFVSIHIKEGAEWRSYRMRRNISSGLYERRLRARDDIGGTMYYIKAYDQAGNTAVTNMKNIGGGAVSNIGNVGEIQ